jgi:hypothetical protein
MISSKFSVSFLGAIQAFLYLINGSSLLVDAWTQQASDASTSRRFWLQQQATTAASLMVGSALAGLPSPAIAAGLPTPSDLEKLRKGHARVQYLLDNWNDETQVCGKMVMSDAERKQVIRTEGKKNIS